MIAARLRLLSGLLLLSFVASHLAAHAVLTASIERAQAVLRAVMDFWQEPVLLYTLFAAILIHAGINLWTLIRRRDAHLPAWHLTQILLGLLIPPLLVGHFIMSRVMYEVAGVGTTYSLLLLEYFVLRPWFLVAQVALLLVAWSHGMIGFWHWLKQTRAFDLLKAPVLVVAIALPALAMAGLFGRGPEIRAEALADPAMIANIHQAAKWTPAHIELFLDLLQVSTIAILVLYVAAAVVPMMRGLVARKEAPGYLSLPDRAPVLLLPGGTLLETLRARRIPHASICGGRARCTTCRVAVTAGADRLAPPSALEHGALERIGAPEGVRLACQIRPVADLSVTPLLPPLPTSQQIARPALAGQEMRLTVMFVDLRESTKLAEKRLPYDVLFLLNRFFAEMVSSLDGHDGHYANFTGDGLMALFGMDGDVEAGARRAVETARDMLDRMEALNDNIAAALARPLAIGIGLHTGDVIVGEMGPPHGRLVSAIGDTVNTAARLEALTKELDHPVAMSLDTCQAAGIAPGTGRCHEVTLRGRTGTLSVAAFDRLDLTTGHAAPQIVTIAQVPSQQASGQ